jgi:hypothetical protein
LTGEARFAEQLERVVLNQLMGAQRCDGAAWGYYVQMEGKRPYSSNLDGHCCLSSGPRGVALIPTFAVSTDAEGLVFNLYDEGSARLSLRDRTAVGAKIETIYPGEERIRIMVEPEVEKAFAVKLRIPAWSPEATVSVNGRKATATRGPDGYAVVQRKWKKGDHVELRLTLEPRVIVGDHLNAGKAAVMYGPLVLAADEGLLGDKGLNLDSITLAGAELSALKVKAEPASGPAKTWPGARVFSVNAREAEAKGKDVRVQLIPFADAGGTGTRYKVWVPVAKD